MHAYGRLTAATAAFAAVTLASLAIPAMADDAGPRVLYGTGTATDDGSGGAFRYDAKLIPEGAFAYLSSASLASGVTKTTLTVQGLLPNRTYGSHLHTKPCAKDPAASGPHYQQVPGTDPQSANPKNEVWLDVTTDAEGTAVTAVDNPWRLREAPGAVVIHADPTDHDTKPGTAGPRIACLTLTAR